MDEAPKGFRMYRKKTLTPMRQIRGIEDIKDVARAKAGWGSPFKDGDGWSVVTTEGQMRAKWGDWLAIDAEGHLYPVADEVHRKSYEVV